MRKLLGRLAAQAKQEEQGRKKEKEQSLDLMSKSVSRYIYDDSSILEDIMDEQRAEGKGYGGSK